MRFVRKKREPEIGKHVAAVFTIFLLLFLFGVQSREGKEATPFIHGDLDVLLSREDPLYIVVTGEARFSVERTWRFGRYTVAKVKPDRMAKTLVQQLLHSKQVLSIYPEMTFVHPDVQTVEYRLVGFDVKTAVHNPSGQWCGRGVTVAIIDTGVDYLHPDLVHSISVLVSTVVLTRDGRPLTWIVGVNGSLNAAWAFEQMLKQQLGAYAWMDDDGHGTHVSGIIASRSAEYPGLSPCVQLIMVKAFLRGAASMDTIMDALQWVYDNVERFGIRVLSISWGAAIPSDGRDPLSIACDAIADKGVLVFAAAGNEGNVPNTILAPAAARKVYAVGAWDGYIGKIAPFSSLGPTVDGRMKPDIYAAGVLVVSTKSRYASLGIAVGDKYAALSGTSMAAPAAAACAANFIEMFKSWNKRLPSRADWEAYLITNSMRLNPFFKDFITGWGLVRCP
ncbi:MAG: S8 family serine peptidase [Thermofilaceae archaeon]